MVAGRGAGCSTLRGVAETWWSVILPFFRTNDCNYKTPIIEVQNLTDVVGKWTTAAMAAHEVVHLIGMVKVSGGEEGQGVKAAMHLTSMSWHLGQVSFNCSECVRTMNCGHHARSSKLSSSRPIGPDSALAASSHTTNTLLLWQCSFRRPGELL